MLVPLISQLLRYHYKPRCDETPLARQQCRAPAFDMATQRKNANSCARSFCHSCFTPRSTCTER